MVITRIILPFILTRTCEARSLALESEEDLPAAVSNQLAGVCWKDAHPCPPRAA